MSPSGDASLNALLYGTLYVCFCMFVYVFLYVWIVCVWCCLLCMCCDGSVVYGLQWCLAIVVGLYMLFVDYVYGMVFLCLCIFGYTCICTCNFAYLNTSCDAIWDIYVHAHASSHVLYDFSFCIILRSQNLWERSCFVWFLRFRLCKILGLESTLELHELHMSPQGCPFMRLCFPCCFVSERICIGGICWGRLWDLVGPLPVRNDGVGGAFWAGGTSCGI